MYNRGIRGATTVARNEEQEILDATAALLKEIVARNEIEPEDICSVWITVTPDLDATFPARAIRVLSGWDMVPLMCSTEIPVQGALPKCIRLLIQVNTTKGQRDMKHVYLNEARSLRPDLSVSGS
ncbi:MULTISPECIES: chorismate mutase [Paenibacillus]|uniref:chorismate mutase n=1 Tax=Paenibacillus mellifer TaxID=2937794 RepID=A0A9X1XW25_9BACL|nr:chorismate mutase [Paenibacillus mellifer]MBW4841152.1 chorismate mutase [Paenibacillaceae bacterium]MCK8486342.1 chorismate mutase [Paenibacillus mellifer]